MEIDSFDAQDDLDGFKDDLEEEFDLEDHDKKMNEIFGDDYYDIEDIDHGLESLEGDLEKKNFNKDDEFLENGKEGFETTDGINASSLSANLCCYSFEEIQAATQDFDESLILGVGGFGKVYLEEIDEKTMKVMINHGNPMSKQGVHEFQTKIEVLSKPRHGHLVSLVGYYEQNYELILVYDYMAHGTLCEHLYNTQEPHFHGNKDLRFALGLRMGNITFTQAQHTPSYIKM